MFNMVNAMLKDIVISAKLPPLLIKKNSQRSQMMFNIINVLEMFFFMI